MARLPIPGSDDGSWGTILNDFLEVAHNDDGSIKSSAVSAAGVYAKPSSGIPASDMTTTVQNQLTAASTAVQTVNSKSGTAVTLTASDVNALTQTTADTLYDSYGAASSAQSAAEAFTTSQLLTTPIYLTWDGSDYTPTSLKSATDRGKIFVGPTDPSGVSGVTLDTYDEWVQTS